MKQEKDKFNPTKEWFEEFRIKTIDDYICQNLFSKSIEDSIGDLYQLIDDETGLYQNFPGFSKKDMEIFLSKHYLKQSKFISNLKELLKKNEVKRSTYSELEWLWIEEKLFW